MRTRLAWAAALGILLTVAGAALLGAAAFHDLESDFQDHPGIMLARWGWAALVTGGLGLAWGVGVTAHRLLGLTPDR